MATYFSKQDGNWSSATTWVTGAGDFVTMSGWEPDGDAGYPPQSFGLERIIIRGGHTVTYDVSGAFGNGIWRDSDLYPLSAYVSPYLCRANAIILSGGTLKAHRTQNTSLSCIGTLGVALSGVLDWGTESDPVSAKTEIVLVTTTNGAQAINPITGTITSTTSGGFAGSNTGIFVFGSNLINNSMYNKLSICGIERTVNTELTVEANAGATTITVLSALNWEIGDDLSIESADIVRTNVHRCKITNINGKIITISPSLNLKRPIGTKVANLNSNVVIRPAYINQETFGIHIGGLYRGEYLIKNCAIKNLGVRNIIRDDGQVVYTSPLAQNTYDGTYNLSQLKIQNVAVPSYLNGGVRPFFSLNGSMADDILVDNIAIDMAPTMWAFITNSYIRLRNSVIYNAGSLSRAFHKRLTVENCKINSQIFDINTGNAQYTIFNNCTIKTPDQLYRNAALFDVQFNQCDLITNPTKGAYFIDTNGIYITTNTTLNNCNLSGMRLYEENASATAFTSREANFSIFNATSGIKTDLYYNFNYHHFSESNYNVKLNGSASYAIRPTRSDNPFSKTFNSYVNAGDVQKIKGNIRLDSTYGTSILPTITFGGVVDTYDYVPPAVTDTWTSFEFDLLPKYSGNLTITIKGQIPSAGPNSYIYIDGLKLDPFVPSVRWYGYEVNNNLGRRLDASTTLTEIQASEYPTPNNLDFVYDESRYWTITNVQSSYYIDLLDKVGNILDFNNRNIIIDEASTTNFSYLSSINELTLKTPILSSGNNFDTIKTTGNVYLSGNSNLNDIKLQGTLISLPKNLESVESTSIKYKTDTPIGITYKNCVVTNVENSGSGLLSITLDNSTITNTSGNISLLFNPTIIDIQNLNGGYIAIFDNNKILKYYQNTDGSISLPNGSTGTWSYRIGRYNYKTIEGTFSVNPLNGVTVLIDPVYIFDSFVNETDVTITSAYEIFNDAQSVYDYLSYFRTTSGGLSGIPVNDLYSYRNVLDVINNKIVFDPSASEKFSYNYGTRTITLSSQKMVAGAIIKGIESTSNLYLSGTHSLSGIYATVGGSVYVETPQDLYSFNLINSGILRYKQNTTPISLTYTDSNIYDVVNDGDAIITITRINSIIVNENDPEIETVVPIKINITVDSSTYWAIYRPNGTRYQYGNGSATLILGGNAVTGNWSYKVVKYGYIINASNFSIDKDISSTTNIEPTLLIDTNITESDQSIVAAYTDLNNTKKIYDYFSHYRTTSVGIDKNIIMSRSIGVITFDGYSVNLDATATDLFAYQTSPNILTVKCSSLIERVDMYMDGDFTQSNGNTISKDVHIRATNLDSEIEFIGINEIIFYPTINDRNSNTNAGPSTTDDVFRFKLGEVYSGVTFSGQMFIRADVGSLILQTFNLNPDPGFNILDLGTFGQIQQVLASQEVINNGIKKASRLIPHSENL